MNIAPTWVQPASFLAEYVTRHGRLPLQSGSDDAVERKAGNILRALRRRDADNSMGADLRAWLNENVEGWNDENVRVNARGMRGRRSFAAQVAATKRFVIRHGHLPSAAGTKDR